MCAAGSQITTQILKYAACITYVTEHANTQLKYQKCCTTKGRREWNSGYAHVGIFLIQFRLRYKFWLALAPGAGRGKLCLCQAPLPPVPLKQCKALTASGASFKHNPGAPDVLKWSPWNKHCRVSGAHDHQVFWKFAFSIPLYLGKRKPVICVL